jgi:hypothetical protein
MVPDSCRVNSKKNHFRADAIDNTVEHDWNKLVSALFRQCCTRFWTILHCRINTIYILCHWKKIYLHSLQTKRENLDKSEVFYLFLYLVHINFIFRQCTYIAYIYFAWKRHIFYATIWSIHSLQINSQVRIYCIIILLKKKQPKRNSWCRGDYSFY